MSKIALHPRTEQGTGAVVFPRQWKRWLHMADDVAHLGEEASQPSMLIRAGAHGVRLVARRLNVGEAGTEAETATLKAFERLTRRHVHGAGSPIKGPRSPSQWPLHFRHPGSVSPDGRQ